jgi:hypothetical protein
MANGDHALFIVVLSVVGSFQSGVQKDLGRQDKINAVPFDIVFLVFVPFKLPELM